MINRYSLSLVPFVCLAIGSSGLRAQDRGGCIPPVPSFTNTAGDTARICEGDFISVNGAASTAEPGRTIEQWVWDLGGNGQDTATIPFAILQFTVPGLHQISLEVIDDIGCSSGASAPIPVLVSATPEFVGTLVPETACEGQVFPLSLAATQPPMLGQPTSCAAQNNAVPLVDTPTPSISLLEVSGQSGDLITDISQLGDICLEIEHSYMGDLVLTVSCPNGQSVILHQQGGGGTFLGDANDGDGNGVIVPGTCFQYCFGGTPVFGTLAGSAPGGTTQNVVPVAQGTAIAPGRYASIEPLEQLLGCPFNGTWTFSSADLFGADNGFLCGWCVSFGEGVDSSFIDQGPVLGTSADSSFWSGPSVVNTPGQPGQATYTPSAGDQTISYTVIDSYGCEHEAVYPISVGSSPTVDIFENTELGLICAQATGPVTYQWSYEGQPVLGAAGTCFTPPGNGLVTVTVSNAQGCSDSASLIITGLDRSGARVPEPTLAVFPIPNNGDFTVQLTDLNASNAGLRITDMTGRSVYERLLGKLNGDATIPLSLALAPGAYFVALSSGERRFVERMVVR